MLCHALLHRDFYKEVPATNNNIAEFPRMLDIAKRESIDYKYLFLTDNPSSSAYKDTYLATKPIESESAEEAEATEQIFLFDKQGKAKELSNESKLINSLRVEKISSSKMFVPKHIKEKYFK